MNQARQLLATAAGDRIEAAGRMPAKSSTRSGAFGADGTALEAEVVAQLLGASRQAAALAASLTRRENQVLALMAEGRNRRVLAVPLYLDP